MDSSLPIINKSYDAYKAIIDLNTQLQKRWKYSLGISLEDSVLEATELLIMAKNAPKSFKNGYLIKASAKWEISMLKLRFMLEEQLANETKIFQIQNILREIGRMLGGWIKSNQT